MSMKMDLIKRGNDAELKMDGYIDATNADEVEAVLVDVAGKFDTLILDMEKLEYVSSAGLRAFKRVYMELRRKGIESEIIDEVLDDIEVDEREQIQAVIERKYPKIDDEKIRRRAVAALQRLGYGWEDIKAVIESF